MYANDMNLTSMDMGGWSSIEAAKKYLGGKVRFSGGLNCKDFYYDFETAKPKIEHAIRIGAPGGGFTLAIGGETYPGVNPDTLIKGVAYAKKVGKYPIKI
jgi:uroporphyrinogen-III decarboxylase